MNTLDKWKTKIKSVNIKQFNNMINKASEENQVITSDPDSQQSTDPNTATSGQTKPQPYMAGISEQVKPQQQMMSPKQQQQPKDENTNQQQQPPPPQKPQQVTFSIHNMAAFSHEELQQVILKYDGEYKKMKIQLKDNSQKLTEFEERAIKAERESSQLKDQAVCYQENVDRLKEQLQSLMNEQEILKSQQNNSKEKQMIEQYQKKLNELMDSKQEYLDKIDELENKVKSQSDIVNAINSESYKHSNQFIEKVKSKDMCIETLNDELKHAKSTIRSQETTISFFRKKVEELQKQLDEEKNERLNLQSEMRRIDHTSSKHNSPKNSQNYISEEDFMRTTQQLINQQENQTSKTDSSPSHKIESLQDEHVMLAQKAAELKIELQDKPPKQASHRAAAKIKSFSHTTVQQFSPSAVKEGHNQLFEDLKKLREDYESLAKEFEECKKQKTSLEEQLNEQKLKSAKQEENYEKLQQDLDLKDKTIQELERRRELAKKEIKVLNFKLEKQKLQSQNSNQVSNTSQVQEEVKSQKEMITPQKNSRTVATEESQQPERNSAAGLASPGYKGLEKLKKIKKELEMFYKDLIKILFSDNVQKEKAIEMEKKVNMIIMSINDQIDEIEIRQVRESQANLKDIQVQQPSLQLQQKKMARANSSDVRVLQQQKNSKEQSVQQARPQIFSMMSSLGSVIGQYNPYSGQQNNNKGASSNQMRAIVGLPPQSPSHKQSQSGLPVKPQHRQQ